MSNDQESLCEPEVRASGSASASFLSNLYYSLNRSILSLRGRLVILMILVSLVFGFTVFVAAIPEPLRTAPREINLIARGMSFYLANSIDGDMNPTIRLKAGEQFRITLHNQDLGMKHTFVVRVWDLVVTPTERDGIGSVLLRAPERPGRYNYVCLPHSALMSGFIEVVAGD